MKYSIVVWCILLSFNVFSQMPIIDARGQDINTSVTISGVVTSDVNLGQIRYIQDLTGALALYGIGDFNNTVVEGDSVTLTGKLVLHNQLLELNPITSYNIISGGHNFMPTSISMLDLGVAYESQLVHIPNISFQSNDTYFQQGTIIYSDGVNSSDVYLTIGHPLIGQPIPEGNIELKGILSRYNNSFRLIPRSYDDLVGAENLYFVEDPKVLSTTPNALNLYVESNTASTMKIKYSTDYSFDLEQDYMMEQTTHEVSLDNLISGTVYHLKVEIEKNGYVLSSPIINCVTSSLSTGDMEVYFNHGYDASVGDGSLPFSAAGADLLSAIIKKIDEAQFTIDVMVYNNNRPEIVSALNAAVARGVRVRYITDTETTNSALGSSAIDFPLLKGNTDNLMHNKILIIDVNAPSLVWVMQGSCNFTGQSIYTDYNNLVFVQDQSLAKIFEVEFEEMWGGNGDFPNLAQSKFGIFKMDNTPHIVTINDSNVEVYFSPSDKVVEHFTSNLSSAQEELSFCIYFFTNNAIADAMKSLHNQGKTIRGIIESINGAGAEYSGLLASGINVKPHPQSGILHHKYCLVDAPSQTSSSALLSGSYNWTGAGTTGNDENYVIYKDWDIVNVFYQEFEGRWCEANNTSCILGNVDINVQALNISPNPIHDKLILNLDNQQKFRILKIISVTGQMVYYQKANLQNGQIIVDTDFLKDGAYFLLLEGDQGISRGTFIKH